MGSVELKLCWKEKSFIEVGDVLEDCWKNKAYTSKALDKNTFIILKTVNVYAKIFCGSG